MAYCHRCSEDTELPHVCDKPLTDRNIPVARNRPDGCYVEELNCAIRECNAQHLIVQLLNGVVMCAVCTDVDCRSLFGRPHDASALPTPTREALRRHTGASAPICDCGGAKARTTHSDWCSSLVCGAPA